MMYMMMNTVNFAKNAIIDFFRHQQVMDDHVLDLLHFQTTCMNAWTSEQRYALEPALVELIREGLLRKDKGYILLSDEGLRQVIAKSMAVRYPD